ncbi:MAG TPA: DUF456 domain-containing protein [Cyclobacteriaceae bacterium]|nr:DUF456 domain-containing protein [Cyclobacteriaceae bacterium]
MDAFLLVLGIVIMLGGIAGSILPLLPGPPLSYLALLIQQFRSEAPYSAKFLITWAIITLVVTLLDYMIPMYGTKKFGGSKYGIWGCTIGLIAGMFFSPLGIIIGPFIGAFIGEIIGNQSSDHALKAALGSFLGFVFGTLLKLVACFVMGWYLLKPVLG